MIYNDNGFVWRCKWVTHHHGDEILWKRYIKFDDIEKYNPETISSQTVHDFCCFCVGDRDVTANCVE